MFNHPFATTPSLVVQPGKSSWTQRKRAAALLSAFCVKRRRTRKARRGFSVNRWEWTSCTIRCRATAFSRYKGSAARLRKSEKGW